VPLDRLAVPEADEQQRLLANLIVGLSNPTHPLPRFWYFASPATRSVILLTSDDHGQVTSRFQDMVNTVEQYGGRMSLRESGLHPHGQRRADLHLRR
jgi:hypothetical protein